MKNCSIHLQFFKNKQQVIAICFSYPQISEFNEFIGPGRLTYYTVFTPMSLVVINSNEIWHLLEFFKKITSYLLVYYCTLFSASLKYFFEVYMNWKL